jgi:hypothetical protein
MLLYYYVSSCKSDLKKHADVTCRVPCCDCCSSHLHTPAPTEDEQYVDQSFSPTGVQKFLILAVPRGRTRLLSRSKKFSCAGRHSAQLPSQPRASHCLLRRGAACWHHECPARLHIAYPLLLLCAPGRCAAGRQPLQPHGWQPCCSAQPGAGASPQPRSVSAHHTARCFLLAITAALSSEGRTKATPDRQFPTAGAHAGVFVAAVQFVCIPSGFSKPSTIAEPPSAAASMVGAPGAAGAAADGEAAPLAPASTLAPGFLPSFAA